VRRDLPARVLLIRRRRRGGRARTPRSRRGVPRARGLPRRASLVLLAAARRARRAASRAAHVPARTARPLPPVAPLQDAEPPRRGDGPLARAAALRHAR